MKKVIERKIYNTETAQKLAHWDNGCSYSDSAYVEEDLYRTVHGAYFLHGRGGPMSVYAESVGNNSRIGCEDIIPICEEEALDWVQEKANNKFVDIFGEEFIQEA